MSFAYCAAPYNSENNNENINNNKKPAVTQRKQTLKNKGNGNNDSSNKIKADVKRVLTDGGENDDLTDFHTDTPVQAYLQNKFLKEQEASSDQAQNGRSNSSSGDEPVQQEAFSQLDSTSSQDYYKQYRYPESQGNLGTSNNNLYTGSYIAPQPSIDSQSELLKKLDNILYLLEEQQEDKTNLITEELILYMFLGIFVIYVLDSFVRVGKYVR